jgi:VWFA-related protein
MRFEPFVAVLYVGLLGITCPSNAMLQEADRGRGDSTPFGWSLKIKPNDRKRKGRPSAPEPATLIPHDNSEIRVETDLVLSDVAVLDKRGTPVRGLRRDDFIVHEDGEVQEIAIFSNGGREIPVSMILLIDHSQSQLAAIETSVEAAKVLVDSLKPTDRMAIVTDDISLLADFTSDKEFLKARLEWLKGKALSGDFGKSEQYSALMATVKEKTHLDGTRQIVIFQTDGDQFQALKRKDYIGLVPFSFDDIIRTALSSGVTVYTVYTGTDLSGASGRDKENRAEADYMELTRRNSLVRPNGPPVPVKISSKFIRSRVQQIEREAGSVESVALLTGGLAQSLQQPAQAAEIYDRILKDIYQRYVIGYYPSNQSRDGKERKVDIHVNGRSGYRIIGRRSYSFQMLNR